jgi:hypothetical protein
MMLGKLLLMWVSRLVEAIGDMKVTILEPEPFLLPKGEGQDDGTNKTMSDLLSLPHPNPLPQGEGVHGTAVKINMAC